MTIDKKINGGYAVVLGLLIIVTATAFYSLKIIGEAYTEFLDVETQAILGATELKLEVRDQTALFRGLLLYPEGQSRYMNDLRDSYHRFNAVVGEMQNLSRSETGRRIIDEIAEIQKKYKEIQERSLALLQQGKRNVAVDLSEKEALPLAVELRDKCDQYIELQQKRLADGREEVSRMFGRSSIVLVSVSLIALISGLGIGFLLARAITGQLRETIAQLSSSSS